MAIAMVQPLAARQALVTGATGQVGRWVLPMLLAEGFNVLALSREGRPAGYPALAGVRWVSVSESSRVPMKQVSHLVSCGPIGLARIWAKQCESLRVISVTSSTSILTKRDSPVSAERERLRAIEEEEQALCEMTTAAGVALNIFRPTLVYGSGLDRNLSLLFRFIERFGFLPVSSQASGLRQPLHAEDLAKALVASCRFDAPVVATVNLVGGETLAYRAMVERLFQALGRQPRIWSLSPAVLGFAVRCMPGLGEANVEMVRRQSADFVFDDGVARRLLEISPRTFQPGRLDFSPPGQDVINRLAGA